VKNSKSSLGTGFFLIQRASIMLKSPVPHFYPKMHLACAIFRISSRLV